LLTPPFARGKICFAAGDKLASDMLQKGKMRDNVMKTGIYIWVAFAVGFISVRADDNPAQAAARAALEQKVKQLDNLQAPGTPSGAALVHGQFVTSLTDTVPAKRVTPQTSISASADDNPAQAAARAALEQKFKQLDNSQAPGTPSGAVLVQPGQFATSLADTVPAKRVTTQASSTATTPAAAPVATAAPNKTQSAAALTMPKPTQTLAATKSLNPPVIVNSTNEIVTAYGTIYKNVEVEKVDSDGIIVSYSTAGGGLAVSKVDFDDLPAELQQRYEKK
jgi:hypothetical protein